MQNEKQPERKRSLRDQLLEILRASNWFKNQEDKAILEGEKVVNLLSSSFILNLHHKFDSTAQRCNRAIIRYYAQMFMKVGTPVDFDAIVMDAMPTEIDDVFRSLVYDSGRQGFIECAFDAMANAFYRRRSERIHSELDAKYAKSPTTSDTPQPLVTE
jgi:hypothetical protein